MADFKQQYKNPRPGFGDADYRRYLRAHNRDKTRREVRTQTFDRNRNLQGVSAPTTPQPKDVSTITDERMKKLIRWKENRERKKRLEAAMKKPAFKVGVVHHSLCSPIIKNGVSTTKTSKKTEQSDHIQKRITRATEKRLLAKAAKEAAAKQGPKNLSSVSTKHLVGVKTPTSNTKKQKSFAPVDYCFKPPSGVQKIPLFGLVPMKQTPQEKYTSSEKDIRTSAGITKNSKTSTSSRLSSNKQSLSQKNIQTFDGTTKNFKTSTSPRLSSNKQNSSQKLIDLAIHDSNDLNVTKKTRSSLKEQTKNQTDIQDSLQEEKSLDKELVKESSDEESLAIDTKTPPSQKINLISPEKENRSMDLIMFSPYLVRGRGKKSSRKEGQQRLGIGRPSDEIPTKDTVMKNLNICVEEEERTAQYFKLLLNKETDRLQQLCKKWLHIGLEKDIPEDAKYEIQQAVGQTNLLINKKFERFHGLVQDCETGKGEMLVTCRDLQGFWDMTYMEVKDCEMRFQKLEQRQNRGWQEEEECTVQAKLVVKKRMPVKKQIVSSKPSSLRSLILAARKNKMEIETLSKEDSLLQDIHTNEKSSNRKSCSELLEENTDTRRSARRSKSYDRNESKSTPVQRQNFRTSFIPLSDKSKRMKSPFAAMKISRMCKTPEVQLDNTVTYVNSDQTPGKSILKKSEELESKEARIKSAHKVNFDDHVSLTEVPLDEDAQINLNLSIALNKIESFNLDETYRINAGKELNFETEESDSNDDLNELQIAIQTIGKRNKCKSPVQNSSDNIQVHPLNDITSSVFIKDSSNNMRIISSPRTKSLKNRVQRKDISNKQDILFSPPAQANRNDETLMTELISNDMEDFDLGRVLRNRTVPTKNTPKSNRTSKMMTPKKNIDKEENKSSVKSNRKSSLRLSQKNENMTPKESDTMKMEDVTLINSIKKRLSRKSVVFDESCVACAENKPVLPMTPHSSRRNKTLKRQSRVKTMDEDLILLNTPDIKHHSRRMTRSQLDNV